VLQRFVNTVKHYRLDASNRRADRLRREREAAWQGIVTGPPRLVTVRSRNGRLTFDSRDSVIGMHLFRERQWEIDLIQRTSELLERLGLLDRSRSMLIDAGANIGSTTVAFLREKTFDRALAFEPDPHNFALLERNVRQNGLRDKVRCLPIAVGDAPGDVELELSPDNFGDHRVRVEATQGAYGEADRATRTVRMERLDDVVSEHGGAASVGLLWMDVQGFEGAVLKGALELVSRGTPVEMELWPYGLARAGTSRAEFLHLLRTSFTNVIDLRDESLRSRPIEEIEDLYDAQVGPYADTEVLLYSAVR
jgi:FkbM family methyltransferase